MIINPGVLAQLTVGNLAAGAVTATSLWAANSPWSTANPNGPLTTANTNTISSPKTTLILSSYSDCDPTLASSQPPSAALIPQNPIIALPFPTSTPFSQPRPHCRSPTASLSSGFSSLLTMGWSTLTNVLFSLLLTLHINAWVSQAQSSPSNNVTADIDVDALCPGYTATNVQSSPTGDTLIADLVLAGPKCNAYGADLEKLRLHVVYESETRLNVKILSHPSSPSPPRYEVPASVFPRPHQQGLQNGIQIQFEYTASPFTFTVSRTTPNPDGSKEILFTTVGSKLVFEDTYLRVKTKLGRQGTSPSDVNVYGLGEHTNPFRLPIPSHAGDAPFVLTLWSRDAYGIATGTNLYGNHPIYFEHRGPTPGKAHAGTHGVFLLNSNGMDVKLRNEGGAQGATLEYNVIGGILDFYFLAGSSAADANSPVELVKQYADVAGKPKEVSYWSLGLHQCRFGYNNYVEVADVISDYAAANIPLEVMWTDIDYMDRRRIFTVDPNYFPMDRMREIVDYLHAHGQKFVLMTDPAVLYLPESSTEVYGPYTRGKQMDIWLKRPNGEESLGLVWPGVTVYPDWFHPNIQEYWSGEFKSFYDPATGLDIDGAWIDMNEPASFCNLPCTNPFQQATEQALPPPRAFPPPPRDLPIFSTHAQKRDLPTGIPGGFNPEDTSEHESEDASELSARQQQQARYAINNAAGDLSSRTAFVDSVHWNNLTEYDTHNLYGTMMSTATRQAMLDRRPGRRPMIITRSTFAGAGAQVGKWLGDNFSTWDHYRVSIAGMLGFASIYQVPMVGSDICGFAGNTTEELCARWATLGAFYPFMRNHNSDTSISQEFYRWSSVAEAARKAIAIRYRLLDYLYTALHDASVSGTPVLSPLWFAYPADKTTYSIDLQYLFGPAVLISPVTEQGRTDVKAYLPGAPGEWFDWQTGARTAQSGWTTITGLKTDSIPVHIRAGSILPLRYWEPAAGTPMTTDELRKRNFEIVVAPTVNSTLGQAASGSLYIDDGDSIQSPWAIPVSFTYAATADNKARLLVRARSIGGAGAAAGEVAFGQVRILGVEKRPSMIVIRVFKDADGSGADASASASVSSDEDAVEEEKQLDVVVDSADTDADVEVQEETSAENWRAVWAAKSGGLVVSVNVPVRKSWELLLVYP